MAGKSSESMVESSMPMVVSTNQPESAAVPVTGESIYDIPELEDRQNQLVVINATLTRIERWFGAVKAENVQMGDSTQVVILLPAGLAWCSKCGRLRLPSSMMADGKCEVCAAVQ